MAKYWAKTKEFFTRDYEKDFESYNSPLSKWQLLGELALVPVILHMLMMLMAYGEHLEDLIQTTNLFYTFSLFVTAVFVDICRSCIAERKYLMIKANINLCCLVPIMIYCVPKLYVAALEYDQHNVAWETCAFFYTNVIFYGFMFIYIKKDFKHLQSKGRMVTETPETLTLSEKKVLSVYNILMHSNCYVIFIGESLLVVLAGPLHASGFFNELAKSHRSRCNSQSGDIGTGLLILLLMIIVICFYQLYAVVTIMQGLWVLSLKNPKSRNDVSFMAIA